MNSHVIEALRYAADKPCHRSNCGTVCLCGPCHARRAIFEADPDHVPKYSKNHHRGGGKTQHQKMAKL